MKPAARREGVLVRALPGELIVYDRGEHRAHCLNRTAAIVYESADGTRSVADLARLLAPEADPAASEPVVEEALARLAEAGLLETNAPAGGWSRREWVRKVGVAAAVLLPVVASILVPAPAEAAVTCCSWPSCTCATKPDLTACTCSGASPCTAACIGGSCSEGGC